LHDELKNIIPEPRLRFNERLASHTSFKIGGPAEVFIEIKSKDELISVIKVCKKYYISVTVLGGCNNVLISDSGLRGVIVKTSPHFSEIKIDSNTVCAEAGANLSGLADAARRAGLSGLEFASGIPGTVGGAVYMNAGAFEGEISDAFVSAEILQNDGIIKEFNKNEMGFSYRGSVLQDGCGFLLSAFFVLKQGDPEEIKNKMVEYKKRRSETQPLDMPSAGSVFKRPSGFYAGKLISDCGLKGYSVGGAKVSEKHAGFIINAGGATAADVLRLIEHIKDTVYEKTGVELEPEIRTLGF